MNSIYTLPFARAPGLPMQQGMNICKCIGLIMRPTRLRFKLSILMGHLQLNYTMFDVWLTVLIFGSCKLRLGQAGRAAARPSWLSAADPPSSCRVDTGNTSSGAPPSKPDRGLLIPAWKCNSSFSQEPVDGDSDGSFSSYRHSHPRPSWDQLVSEFRAKLRIRLKVSSECVKWDLFTPVPVFIPYLQ